MKYKNPGNDPLVKRRKKACNTDEFGLNVKQRRFCDHLIADPNRNRHKAYKAAGYGSKTQHAVSRNSWNTLQLPHVQAYIKMRQRKLQQKPERHQSRVLDELCNIGFLDPADLFDEFGTLRHIQEVPVHARKAIAQIDVFTKYEGRGNNRVATGHTTRIKFVDKKGALDSIARILGYFQQDKIDTDGIAKLMEMIGSSRGGSTIGRLNSTANDGSRPVLGPVVATQQPVHDSGQGGQRGPLPAQLGADGAARKLLVHEPDTEMSTIRNDNIHRHPVAG